MKLIGHLFQYDNYLISNVSNSISILFHLFCKYRGAVAGSNTPEATDRLAVLKDEIQRLEDFEKVVDKHKAVK